MGYWHCDRQHPVLGIPRITFEVGRTLGQEQQGQSHGSTGLEV